MVCYCGIFTWCIQLFAIFVSKMDEVVTRLLQKWCINDAEDLAMIKLEDHNQLAMNHFWLVGKLLNSKPFNKESLKHTMKNIWRTSEEVSVSEWKNGDRFLFSFKSELDRRRVLRGSPWSFDKSLLVLSPTDGNEDPSTVPLEKQNFWILVWGLPSCLLTRAMAIRTNWEYCGEVRRLRP